MSPTKPGRNSPPRAVERIKELVALYPEWTGREVHRRIDMEFAGEPCPSYETTLRIYKEAHDNVDDVPWAPERSDAVSSAVVLEAVREIRWRTERAWWPTATTAASLAWILGAYPDCDVVVAWYFAITSRGHAGMARLAAEALAYRPWRDEGQELELAAKAGLVSENVRVYGMAALERAKEATK